MGMAPGSRLGSTCTSALRWADTAVIGEWLMIADALGDIPWEDVVKCRSKMTAQATLRALPCDR